MILAMRLPLRLGVCMRKRRVRCLVSGGDGGALKNPGSATVGPAGAQMVFHSDSVVGDFSLRQAGLGILLSIHDVPFDRSSVEQSPQILRGLAIEKDVL